MSGKNGRRTGQQSPTFAGQTATMGWDGTPLCRRKDAADAAARCQKTRGKSLASTLAGSYRMGVTASRSGSKTGVDAQVSHPVSVDYTLSRRATCRFSQERGHQPQAGDARLRDGPVRLVMLVPAKHPIKGSTVPRTDDGRGNVLTIISRDGDSSTSTPKLHVRVTSPANSPSPSRPPPLTRFCTRGGQVGWCSQNGLLWGESGHFVTPCGWTATTMTGVRCQFNGEQNAHRRRQYGHDAHLFGGICDR